MHSRPAIPAAPIRNGHLPPDNQGPMVGLALVLCLPLGLVAFFHSRCVQTCWQAGDREGARRAGEAAFTWSVRALLVPVSLFVLFMCYWAFYALCDKYTVQTYHLQSYERAAERPPVE